MLRVSFEDSNYNSGTSNFDSIQSNFNSRNEDFINQLKSKQNYNQSKKNIFGLESPKIPLNVNFSKKRKFQEDKENIMNNNSDFESNNIRRMENRQKSFKSVKDPLNPISHNEQKSPSKGYLRKHNYIPRKKHAKEPTMRLENEEMSMVEKEKYEIENKLLKLQIERDHVNFYFKFFFLVEWKD